MSWRKFTYRAIFMVLLTLIVLLYLGQRFTLGIDTQTKKCIEGYSVFLIDKFDNTIVKDKTFAFYSKDTGVFKKNTKLVKFIRAIPNDLVEINKKEQVLVNGKIIHTGLGLAKFIHRKKTDFIGTAVIPNNQYWFMGNTDASFDSRYWGTIGKEKIIGRAYAIW